MNTSPTTNGPDAGRARPVQEIRVGAIRAAIWRNETESGIRHNVTFERIYRDGEEWRSTSSFGRDDLLLLGKVADQAHTWIHGQGRETTAGANPAATPSTETASTGAAGQNRARRRPDSSFAKGTLPPATAGA